MMNLIEGFMNPESLRGKPLDGRKLTHIQKNGHRFHHHIRAKKKAHKQPSSPGHRSGSMNRSSPNSEFTASSTTSTVMLTWPVWAM
jgi:hypothetical protein